MRWILCAVLVILASQSVHAEQPGIKTQLVLATVRIVNPKSSATGFILTRAATEETPVAHVLITSAHVFEKAEGEEVTL
ncbi:MAG TPA: hypothetical protein VL096_11965, partial [Pirellulaceae bacterium]|nr:hypothetical protein [Pirellulaceae bacterium]